MKPACAVLIIAGMLAGAAGAQTAAQPKILTNHDVVVLAKAGFSEQFLIDTILSGRARFDTSASGLADLAKEGINERVVRVMAGVGSPGEDGGTDAASNVQPAAAAGAELAVPGTERKVKSQVVKPTRAGLAIATETPYFESTSILFGLFHKQVGVGLAAHPDQIIAPQLGTSGNSSKMIAGFPTLVAPSGAGKRYVVIP